MSVPARRGDNESWARYHSNNLSRLRNWVLIPPYNVLVFLSVNDGVVVRCLPFVGAAGMGFAWGEVFPVDLQQL